ncbi:hypothetical protein D8B23_10730 [Verminephrobacter aporrectodeae subsp. tuberculatae]|uniref:Lipoprotein n=1 Tax=Verminephrobacter aporrectodeae subsp. tuberculatae TaxID=1110392 RepID=A0ABT3KXG4_9BURK|nr:hypothetical protein [Verminephrobacter aporrectodeae]MCW5221936.1 hypothetical protein [Verminephrobacter aporrectodeae subsp. tuberculatae]MCW5258260.1 hypothetical protein [Verminephrobacter aporrectodeae subsp. tuberculatae]MCW5291227.1 hypothetical protein [Verminephrobacter aporrectodeae subsp. tuberculatae]MCW5322609.1 hypothetical protein [Verminephrobacter aporrectodeae subsp. tuberculatae]MCW8166104.1 hypothetical protein [Verminephrobacter aporrectodeae subsp. tuberculatae]
MKTQLALAVAGAILLTACGSKTDVSEKNFGAAIKQYLEKKGELCLGLGEVEWPVDVSEDSWKAQKDDPTSTVRKMEALAAVDLVSGTDAEIDEVIWGMRPTGRKLMGKRYALTDAGKKFYRKQGGDICYGNLALDKIVKWEGPMKLGDYQEAGVTFLYEIDDLAGWAKKSEIQTAFPKVGAVIEGAEKKEQKHQVKLTSLGWEAIGLD